MIESTAAKYDGKKGRIYRTYFKGNGTGCDGKRATWTKWFKSPYLTYENEVKPAEPTPEQPKKDNFLGPRGYIKLGDKGDNVDKISKFMYLTFPAYTSKNALGDYYGKYIQASIKEFQKRTGLEQDGCIGPITLKMLVKYGFKY